MTHQHPSRYHNYQRRPPDVEEALSSMLWTPYECTPTDSSSDDDDDEWQSQSLCHSQSNFDYRNLPLSIHVPLSCTYFGVDDTTPHTISSTEQPDELAQEPNSASRTKAFTASQTTLSTPFVPFTNLFYNHCNNNNRSTDSENTHETVATLSIAMSTSTSTSTSMSTSPLTNYQFHRNKDSDNDKHRYDFLYPHFGEIPSLNKWWSTSGGITATTMISKKPPPYESLYAATTRSNDSATETSNQIKAPATNQADPTESITLSVKETISCNQDAPAEVSEYQRQPRDFSNQYGKTSISQNGNFENTFSDNDSDPSNENLEKLSTHRNNNNEPTSVKENREHHLGRCAMKQNNFFNVSQEKPHCEIWPLSNPYSRCGESAVLYAPKSTEPQNRVASNVPAPSVGNSFPAVTTDFLIPNKCLAELERLYAEFRASESLIERHLNTFHRRADEGTWSGCDTSAIVTKEKMRLNIPASFENIQTENPMEATPKGEITSTTAQTTCTVLLNSSAGPFLSDNINDNNNSVNCSTVSILSTSDPAYHENQSALTIQVNRVNEDVNQSVIKNNGVSVVNCNYVKPKSISNSYSYSSDRDNNNVSANSVGRNASVDTSSSSVPISSYVNNHLNNNNIDDNKNSYTGNNSAEANENDIKSNNQNDFSIITAHCSDSVHHVIKVNNVPTSIESAVTPVSKPKSQDNSNAFVISSLSESPKSPSLTTTPTHRTFTSTECQTDDISPALATSREHNNRSQPSPSHAQSATNSREERRRERRERRQHHQQQQNQPSSQHLMPSVPATRRHAERHSLHNAALPSTVTHLHPTHMHHPLPSNATIPSAMTTLLRPMLPDLLHSHFPPPYSALPITNATGAMSVSIVTPPASSLLTHTPTITAASTSGPQPPGTTILTPVISTVPIPGTTSIVGDGRFSLPLPIMRRSPSERSGKGCCGQWFAGPPLRALIAVVALGGVACALGGAALGATGLAGPPSSHLTAALLMIGVGVVLVTVSGAAWRMTAPGGPSCLGLGSSVDLGRCSRRPCSRGSGASHGLLYPEFQHRPPPPSYQASMQEYRLRLLLLDRDRQSGAVRGSSPPPTYRSHVRSLLRAPITTTARIGGCSSSIGGSEYSLPPSYRSRNNSATPATVSSERSIETAPSGRLLANEDIPEPLCIEQLPEYNLSQYGTNRGTVAKTKTVTTPKDLNQEPRTRTNSEADIVGNGKIASTSTPHMGNVLTNYFDNDSSSPVSSTSKNGKDLVTIVTISEANTETIGDSCQSTACSPSDHIEILAHL